MLDLPPPEAMFEPFPGPIREVAVRLRALVPQVVPDAIEVPDAFGAIRPGRRAIGYRIRTGPRRAPYFSWILAEAVHAHLGFEHGALLVDPEQRLEGTEFRRIRFLTFRDPAELADETTLAAFLREAARVAAWTRVERMAHILDASDEPIGR
jgi:hypothetical protein